MELLSSKKYPFRTNKPEDYPTLDITYQKFVDGLKEALVSIGAFNVDELNSLYGDYKETQYSYSLNWVKNNGYETAAEWAENYFKHWDTPNVVLKSKNLGNE